MAGRLAHIDASFDLHYCAKSEKRAAFRAKIQAYSFADRVHFHFDDGPDEQRFVAATALGAPAADRHAYVCGPSGFIDHVIGVARERGWSEEQVHTEYFGAAPTDTTGDRAFRVTLASTGETITVPADKSVSDVLIEHGVALQLSCQQGVCGTCITRILSGKIDHRDYFFTDAEHQAQDIFTPCCSRALGDLLVLDM